MKALYNTETILITRLIDTTEQNISKYLKENEDYKNYPFNNDLSKGQNINKYTDMGTLRPNSELVAENLITLEEDQILDGEIIRDLTEEELQEKYPDRHHTLDEVTIDEELKIIETQITEKKESHYQALLKRREELKQLKTAEKMKKNKIKEG